MRGTLFNQWATEYKPEATLEDFMVWIAGYDARNNEIRSLKSEIDRLHEIISEKSNG